jgi:uncharacterized protein (TIGR00266 family)
MTIRREYMNYTIQGTTMPLVEMVLNSGERVVSQSGAMKWMSSRIDMQTRMTGGVSGFLKRAFSQESGFLTYFEAREDYSRIAFGHTYPGTILPIDVSEQSIICQKRSFLCSEPTVILDIAFQKRLSTAFFGGEGLVMQELKGRGMAFLEADGEVVSVNLSPGETIKVETGAVAFYDSSVAMNIEMVKGVSNVLFGGEGLFLTSLTGPGRVWIQTLSIQSLAQELYPFLPQPKSN